MIRLPPLKALRAFEAAARHKSFTAAAEELHVTHGAVSRQIQQLEEFLGKELFERLPRGVRPTPGGRDLAISVRHAFAEVAEAVELLKRRGGTDNALTISTLSWFAGRWLIPRLPRFQRAHPDIDIRISTSPELVDFRRDAVDLAVRFGRGKWPGLAAHFLFGHVEFPVCSPVLLEGENALRSPADLARVRLLHDFSYRYWASWLKFAGLDDIDPTRGWLFDDLNTLLQAAIAGQGVALVSPQLIESEVEAGRLVRPFELSLPRDVAYYAVCPLERAAEPRIAALIEWLVAEASTETLPLEPIL